MYSNCQDSYSLLSLFCLIKEVLLSNSECRGEFRFSKNDINRLCDALGLPDEITFYNGIEDDSTEVLCTCLKRFAYPCRYVDLVPRFARPVPQLCIITNHMIDFIFGQWGRLLSDFQQQWLVPVKLDQFADSIHSAGSCLVQLLGIC